MIKLDYFTTDLLNNPDKYYEFYFENFKISIHKDTKIMLITDEFELTIPCYEYNISYNCFNYWLHVDDSTFLIPWRNELIDFMEFVKLSNAKLIK